MTGKVALVTGAAGGIGSATAVTFAQIGCDVAITDLNEEGLKNTAAAIEKEGRKAFSHPCDITDFDAVQKMAKAAHDHFGRIDVLANVAGWSQMDFFLKQDPAVWETLMARNLWGTIYATRAVMEFMVQQDSGSIVNVASDAGRAGAPGEAVYSAAKGGVIAFTKSIAREGARNNIRVNCVSPAMTDTQLVAKTREAYPSYIEKATSVIPLRRIATPQEQANAIVFLGSDAASYITGQVLSVNGGVQMA